MLLPITVQPVIRVSPALSLTAVPGATVASSKPPFWNACNEGPVLAARNATSAPMLVAADEAIATLLPVAPLDDSVA
jgi:hypothetical protein